MIDLTDDDDDVFDAAAAAAQRRKRGRAPSVVDLTDGESAFKSPAAVVARAKAATAAAAASKPKDAAPAWVSKMGTQRIMAEFREMRSWDDSPQVDDLQLVQDCAARWRFKARNFDSSSDGGRDLNADLAQLLRKRGRDYIVMEVSFPKDYPTSPFSLRVVSPRMRWYTGHVSAGGSICIAALTTDGSPNAWRKTHNVESVLRTVFANMLYCDVGVIRTANGGGKTGPLRVDLEGRFGHDVLSEYSEHEASEGFRRMLDHHRRHGW